MSSLIGTWKFSSVGIAAAAEALIRGGTAVDAVEKGIATVEKDATVTSAGFGGLPNAAGVLQLDAALMTGCGRVGAVSSGSVFWMREEGHDSLKVRPSR